MLKPSWTSSLNGPYVQGEEVAETLLRGLICNEINVSLNLIYLAVLVFLADTTNIQVDVDPKTEPFQHPSRIISHRTSKSLIMSSAYNYVWNYPQILFYEGYRGSMVDPRARCPQIHNRPTPKTKWCCSTVRGNHRRRYEGDQNFPKLIPSNIVKQNPSSLSVGEWDYCKKIQSI